MRRGARPVGIALLILGTLASGVAAAQAPPAPGGASAQPAASGRLLDPPNGVLIAPGDAPDLSLLYTGDVVGYIEPCG